MDNQITGQTENAGTPVETDPWAAAFAALEQAGKVDPEGSADAGSGAAAGQDAGGAGGNEALPDAPAADDGNGSQDAVGGLDLDAGIPGSQDRDDDNGLFQHVGEQELQQYRDDLDKRVKNQAVDEIAKEFVKRGVRNRNGILGATIEDADICKRDKDGVPRFYNPETGREFTGDNPRRQAQEWVDDYNKELARVFNEACQKYEAHLRSEAAPALAVMEFAPKYEKLDDIRRGMLDNVIQDYEVKDGSGNVIGYSCDLDKALAMVERQIAMIQDYAKQHRQQPAVQPTRPALDMKTSSGAIQSGQEEPPKSLAEAMERLQNAQLAKMKR